MVVDPVMGDTPKGLYVKPEVAERVASRLVPLADWITPNIWELWRLSGRPTDSLAETVAAARALGRPALVTSVPAANGEIGLLYVTAEAATLFTHPRVENLPNGTGDLVAASFGAGLAEGLAPEAAALRAAQAAAETVQATLEWRASELPIVALADRLVNPRATVHVRRL